MKQAEKEHIAKEISGAFAEYLVTNNVKLSEAGVVLSALLACLEDAHNKDEFVAGMSGHKDLPNNVIHEITRRI